MFHKWNALNVLPAQKMFSTGSALTFGTGRAVCFATENTNFTQAQCANAFEIL
jgi:hypothetical protein